MFKILFQGDSITDGNRFKDEDLRWDLNHQIGHSYAYIVAAHLLKNHLGKFEFVNRAVSGNTEKHLAERWQKDTLDHNPDLLSILLGINGFGLDVVDFTEDKVKQFLEEFDTTYRYLLDSTLKVNPNVKFVLIEPFCLPAGKYKENYNDFMKCFSHKQEIVKRIAKDYNAMFIPTQEQLNKFVKECDEAFALTGCKIDPNEYWLWDGIHGTEALHGFLAERWLEVTKGVLPI